MNRLFQMGAATLTALLLLSACGGEPEQPAANAGASASRSAPAPNAAPVPALAGAWTVIAINGAAPRQVWPMAVTATAGEFAIQSDCRRFAWAYRQDRNIVEFKPLATRECARMRSPDESQVGDLVGFANIAMFTDAGREVEITGPGGRLTLARR